jgi:hypothetical protein
VLAERISIGNSLVPNINANVPSGEDPLSASTSNKRGEITLTISWYASDGATDTYDIYYAEYPGPTDVG